MLVTMTDKELYRLGIIQRVSDRALLRRERPCDIAVTRADNAPLMQAAGAEPDAVSVPP